MISWTDSSVFFSFGVFLLFQVKIFFQCVYICDTTLLQAVHDTLQETLVYYCLVIITFYSRFKLSFALYY